MKKISQFGLEYVRLLLRHVWSVICLLLCIGNGMVYAQGRLNTDELKHEIAKAEHNKNKVDLCLELAGRGYDDTGLVYAQQARLLSDKLKYKYGQIKSRLIAGDIQRLKKEWNSVDYLLEAKQLLEEYDDIKLEAWCYSSLGRYYYHIRNILPEALKYTHQSIALYEKLGNTKNLCDVYGLCGMIYNRQNEKEDALIHFDKSIQMATKINDLPTIAYVSNCMSEIYMDDRKLDEALQYNLKALAIYDSLGDRGPAWGIAWTYYYIGYIYSEKANIAWEKGRKDTARQLYDKALHIYRDRLKMELDIGQAKSESSYLDLANWYIRMILIGEAPSVNEYINIADGYLSKCIYNSKHDNILSVLSSAYLSRSILDSLRGNYHLAYNNHKLYNQLMDSMRSQQNAEDALRMKMQYDFDKKEAATKAEQDKKDIRQRNIRNASFTTVGILLLFSFIVMRQRNKIYKEKKVSESLRMQSESLLLNILPAEVADELKTKGSAEARQFDQVSILFTDFASFTQTAEHLEARALVQELHACFTAFDNIMERYGLEKIKTIGDAYLAVCGLPVSDPQHAQKTVLAAIEIRNFMEKRSQYAHTFRIRIGIHSGSVVAGIVGVKKFAYDIWGDTVNTAARMEQSGEPGKVNISGVTYELVKEAFNCTYRGEVVAKNKGMMKMYFVE